MVDMEISKKLSQAEKNRKLQKKLEQLKIYNENTKIDIKKKIKDNQNQESSTQITQNEIKTNKNNKKNSNDTLKLTNEFKGGI